MTCKTKLLLQIKMAKECILSYAVLPSKPKAAQAHLAAATKQWHTQHGVKLFPSILSSPCGHKWSSFKAKRDKRLLQDQKGSPSRSRGWSRYQPQISLRKYAKTYEGSCSRWCPRLSHKVLNVLDTYICIVQSINQLELKKVINFWAR